MAQTFVVIVKLFKE